MISCDKDDKQYLGQTGSTGERHGIGHLKSIMNNNETAAPVGFHFRSQNHSNTNFTMVAFERHFSKNPKVRRARESDKINRFELIEHGLKKNL